MNRLIRVNIIFFLVLISYRAAADSVGPARPTLLQSPDMRACEMFLLDGANGSNTKQWYGVSRGNTGYKEAVAALLAAKAGNREIQFETAASGACGGDTSVLEVTRLFLL